MKEVLTVISSITEIAKLQLNQFLGGYDDILSALTIFVIIGYITAVMCTIVTRKFSGDIGIKGICRRILIFLFVGMAHTLDIKLLGTGNILRSAVILFYISVEGMRVLKEADSLDSRFPDLLKSFLEQLHSGKK